MYILGVYYLRKMFCFTECSFAYISIMPKSNFVLLNSFYDCDISSQVCLQGQIKLIVILPE